MENPPGFGEQARLMLGFASQCHQRRGPFGAPHRGGLRPPTPSSGPLRGPSSVVPPIASFVVSSISLRLIFRASEGGDCSSSLRSSSLRSGAAQCYQPRLRLGVSLRSTQPRGFAPSRLAPQVRGLSRYAPSASDLRGSFQRGEAPPASLLRSSPSKLGSSLGAQLPLRKSPPGLRPGVALASPRWRFAQFRGFAPVWLRQIRPN